ncbi:aminotransferase class IV [Sphingomonas panni]
MPLDPRDLRLAHKTSDRRFWPAPPPGCFETIFVNAQGELTEGSFTSIFVDGGAQLLTPPLDRGLLPGILRAELIARGRRWRCRCAPPISRKDFTSAMRFAD